MQLIIDFSKPDAAAHGKMILLPARKILHLVCALLAVMALAAGAGAYFLAAYLVESGSPLAHRLHAVHAARQDTQQTQEWQAHMEALRGELATLNARVLELYNKGAVLSEQVGLPGEQLFALNGARAQVPMLCDSTAEAQDTADGITPAPAYTHALVMTHLQQQGHALDALERNYTTLKNQRIHNDLLSKTLPMERPVLGQHWISSRYGYRKDPFTGRRAFHAGDDLAARRGTPIMAAAEGLVTYAGRLGRYGNTVKIKHGGSISTLYGHMHKIYVKPGQHVQKGEIIGSVGSTGRSTAPHLHYEVRVNNRPASVRRTIKKLRQARIVQQPAI